MTLTLILKNPRVAPRPATPVRLTPAQARMLSMALHAVTLGDGEWCEGPGERLWTEDVAPETINAAIFALMTAPDDAGAIVVESLPPLFAELLAHARGEQRSLTLTRSAEVAILDLGEDDGPGDPRQWTWTEWSRP